MTFSEPLFYRKERLTLSKEKWDMNDTIAFKEYLQQKQLTPEEQERADRKLSELLGLEQHQPKHWKDEEGIIHIGQ